jgi:hypothetical protein
MPIPTYTPGYPPDGSSLGQTKATIRNNLDGTFETLNVDHVNNNGQPGSNPAGYHTVVHEVTQTSVSTVSGVNQIFSGVPGVLQVNAVTTPAVPPGGDTQLYSLSGSGILSQLTGGSRTGNGYMWLGQVLLQWGTQNLTNSATQRSTVNYATANINFPNFALAVYATLICKAGGTSSSQNTLSLVAGTFTNTGFQYQYSGSGGGDFPGFFWLAIGY